MLNKYPLLTRLIFFLFIFSLGATILIVGGRLYYEYNHHVLQIGSNIDELEKSQLNILVSNVWTLNDQAIKIQLDSILHYPDITYLELVDTDGSDYAVGDKPASEKGVIVREFGLFMPDPEGELFLGKLRAYATTKNVRGEMFQQLPLVIFSSFVEIFLICFVVFLLVVFFFLRPLRAIVKFTTELDIEGLGRGMTLDHRKISNGNPDELDRIVIAINEMSLRLQEGISLKEKAEDSLRKSEEKYRGFMKMLPQIVFEIDREATITYANRIAFEKIGYSQEDFEKGINGFQIVVPEERNRLIENATRIMHEKIETHNEYSILRKDGSSFPGIIFSQPNIQDEKVIGIRGMIVDIADLRASEAALRDSEERFRTLISQAADAIFVHDMQGDFIDVNKSACESLGYSRAELFAMNVKDVDRDFFKNHDMVEFLNKLTPVSPVTIDGVHRRKDGTTFPVEIRLGVLYLSGQKVILALARDVSKRKQAEESLRRNEELYRTLVDSAPF